MSDPVPLEKVQLPVKLGGGINELARAETADPFSTLTRAENLIQDQADSYVKRPGQSVLGSTLDYDGVALASPTKALRLKSGLALIANSGTLHHYQEGPGLFLKKGFMPQYVVKSVDLVANSGPTGLGNITAVASSSEYHAVVVAGNTDTILSLYDRESGGTVRRFSMGYLISQSFVAFVADRYLHVYFTHSVNFDLYGFVIDTQSPVITISPTVLKPGTVSVVLRDVAVHTDRSYVIFQDSGVSDYVVSMDNAGALADSAVVATGTVSMSNSGTKLWLMDGTNLTAVSLTSLSTVVVAAGAHGVTAGFIVAGADNIVHSLHQATETFGATTIARIDVSSASVADGTTLTTYGFLNGWDMASAPFLGLDNKIFVHLSKQNAVSGEVGHVIVNVTQDDESLVIDTNFYHSWRIACSLDPLTAAHNRAVLRYLSYDGNATYCPAIQVLTAERSFGYSVFTIRQYAHADIASAGFGGSTYISGGCHSAYGGDLLAEVGFVDRPIVNTVAGAATGLTGLYNYVAVYRRSDETGAITWSRVSDVSTVSVTNHKVDVTVCPAAVTNSDLSISQIYYETPTPLPSVGIDLYRTEAGGTQYYLVSSTMVLAATRFYTFTDNVSDATLRTQQLMFRQPGTTNSSIDRYPPPSGNPICSHKDRLFTTDPYGVRVYYSSFFVDGETAWFNPVFSFFTHGGTGPITGLVSMDGRLFVFKRDGVFVVDGDGPAEGGVAGNEFSPPQRLATEYGCVDHRSIVVTTDGIFYRSPRGIELLTRSLQVRWIGDMVNVSVDANPYTCGAALDSFGRVHYLLADSVPSAVTVAGLTGVELVYDLTFKLWTKYLCTGSSLQYGEATQGVVIADIAGLGETIVYVDPALGATYADESLGLDRGQYYVPWVIESGWFRTGQQARQRISEIMLLAKKNAAANHAIKMSLAYNFSDTYTQTFTWQPGDLTGLPIEELVIQPEKPQSLAIRVKIEEVEPSSVGPSTGFTAELGTVLSYLSNFSLGVVPDATEFPVGTGRGCDVLGITVEIAQKRGMPKLSPGQSA